MNNGLNNVVLTGDSGFLGSNVKSYLIKKGFNVTGINSKHDITDFNNLIESTKNTDIDYICHFAGNSLRTSSGEDLSNLFSVNIGGVINVMELAKKRNIKAIFFASSARSDFIDLNKREEVKINAYDISKFCGEQIVAEYSKSLSIPVIILRIGNVFGEGDYNTSRFIPSLINSILKKNKFSLKTPLEKKNFIYIKDLVELIYLSIINISSFKPSYQLIKAEYKNKFIISDIADFIFNISDDKNKTQKSPDYSCKNNKWESLEINDEIINNFNWKPNCSFETALKNTFNFYKDTNL